MSPDEDEQQSNSNKIPMTSPPPLNEWMRKRRAAFRILLPIVTLMPSCSNVSNSKLLSNFSVSTIRNNTSPGCGEDITPPPSSLGSTPSPCWNNAMHHPIRFHVLPFHQHHSLIQQTHSLCPLPLVIKTETKPLDSDDSDVEVEVTSTPSSPPSRNLPSSSVPVS
uniref:Uncharacterized protein n=1 Tax=Daphnia galeata TaxID=27404 RepID=A0A8J2RTD0_9CRUS|nr:unnamed protein product [Daphnia galeata]